MNSAKQLVFTFSSYFKPLSCANTCYLCCFHLETFLACSLAVSDEEEVLNDENVDSWEDIDGNIFQSFVFPLVKKGSYLYCNEISILTSSYTNVIICQTM